MCAAKLIIFATVFSFLVLVSWECPTKCHCTRYKMFCSLAELNSFPSSVSSTTQFLRIELDRIFAINTTRGLQNLTHLELVKVQLKNIQHRAFSNLFQLEYLAITHNNITVLHGYTFDCLENLYFLNLSYNNISDLKPRTFAGLDNIRILDLSNNKIKHLNANVFLGMKYLTNCSLVTMPYESEFWSKVLNFESEIFRYLCTFTYFRLGSSHYTHVPKTMHFGLSISRGILYKNIFRTPSGFLYLHMNYIPSLTNFKSKYFQNLSSLVYLDLSENGIKIINSGDFEELAFLKTLKINYNNKLNPKSKAFHGLKSLESLEMSNCNIIVIKSEIFDGLYKLQMLDLRGNMIQLLENNTFSTLRMLKILKLDNNKIQNIDIAAFWHLTYLKHLTLGRGTETSNFYNTTAGTFADFARLDTLIISGFASLPQNIQILKTLDLHVDASSVNSQEKLHDMLQTVHYIRNLHLALYKSNSIEIIEKLSEFPISRLVVSCNDLKFLKNSIIHLPKLEFFAVYDLEIPTIVEKTFYNMASFTELELHYHFLLTYSKGSFYGLNNLKSLRIRHQFSLSYKPVNLKCLEEGVFLGLYNLTKLFLTRNYITCLSPGTFYSLGKIEEINLSNNRINEINPGVFGALCKNDFEISCKNVTLSEYCNGTNALTTLKYLNLTFNNITYIHQHAFISCTNLQTLALSGNSLLNLDHTFLYTPGLKILHMANCNIGGISNNTFECTPLLSNIKFSNNDRLTKLRVHSLLPLRDLRIIELSYCPLLCDCKMYETWIWLRQHHVHYITNNYHTGITTNFCGNRDIDQVLANIKCNNTNPKLHLSKKITTIRNDFAIFKKYIEPIVLIIIFTSGIVSNGFLLFISLWHSDMRTKQNACVIQLAIVDILSLMLNLPLSYWDVLNVRWEFDDTFCKVFIFSKDVTVGVAVLSVVALSVERFLVAKEFKNLRKICKSRSQPTAWLLFMTWISAIVTSLPAYLSATVNIRCLYCPPDNRDYIRNVWTFQLVIYCLAPAVVIMFLYIKTSSFLRESVSNIPGEIKDNIKIRNRKRAANTVLILAAVFIISYLPSYILRALVAWSVVDMENVFLLSFFTFCLFFFNTVFNPVSLFIMSSKFKSHALKYFPFLEES